MTTASKRPAFQIFPPGVSLPGKLCEHATKKFLRILVPVGIHLNLGELKEGGEGFLIPTAPAGF